MKKLNENIISELKSRTRDIYKTEYQLNKIILAYQAYSTPIQKEYMNSFTSINDKTALKQKYRNAKETIIQLFSEVETEHSKEILEYLSTEVEYAINGITTSYSDIRKGYQDCAKKELLKADFSPSTIQKLIIPIFKDILHGI